MFSLVLLMHLLSELLPKQFQLIYCIGSSPYRLKCFYGDCYKNDPFFMHASCLTFNSETTTESKTQLYAHLASLIYVVSSLRRKEIMSHRKLWPYVTMGAHCVLMVNVLKLINLANLSYTFCQNRRQFSHTKNRRHARWVGHPTPPSAC